VKNEKHGIRTISVSLLVAASLLVIPNLSFATTQGQQRQQGRDVKQDTRQDSRGEKANCRAADQKSYFGRSTRTFITFR
jgi:hypothetical protein